MSSAFLAPVAAASTLVVVPYDVLNLLLSACPDFATLYAAVGVCSTWHTVFLASRKSILVSVAENFVGPALRQAVRFVRYPYPEKTPSDWAGAVEGDESVTESDTGEDDDDKPAKKSKPVLKPPPYSEREPIGMLSPEERFKLQENADTVRKLEALFVVKSGHPTSLTFSQSHRLTRALYRIMLFCELFYLPLNLDDIDSMEDNEPGILAKIRSSRAAHFRDSGYTTPELFEIRSVVDFLYELINDCIGRPDPSELDRVKDICLATGPRVILQAHEQKSEEPFEEALEVEVMSSGEDNEFFGGFLTDPIAVLVKEQKAGLPVSVWGAILDDDDNDSLQAAGPSNCAQCGIIEELWHKANWSRLIAVDFCTLLPGVLNQNDIEAAALVELLMGATTTSRVGAEILIAELYDAVPSAGFATWTKDERLCVACLERFVGAHLVGWLYKRKVADGWTPTPNCWYGWNCKTQVHKMDHAKSKNHLCAPIR
ncbi:hypothetical protein C8F01DRAFT_1376560 [Mycena amicta]|nr:hypothetical protein C8F01DRAFT_1376560 [Mycena amicta]